MKLLFSILKLLEAKAILLSLQQKKITLKVNLTVYSLFFKKIITWVFFAIRLNNWQFLEMTQAIHYWEFFKTLVKCDVTFWIISWVDYSVRSVSSPFFWVPRDSSYQIFAWSIYKPKVFIHVDFVFRFFLGPTCVPNQVELLN